VYAAAVDGHVEAIRALRELGADIDTPEYQNITPVFAAAEVALR
jgi:hypothetical protein